MTFADVKKVVKTRLESLWVVEIDKMREKDADGVEAESFGISELAVDGLRVECALLPHLNLVYRR